MDMGRVRGFEPIRAFEGKDIRLPERSTKDSAGYDFFAPEDIVVPSCRFEFSQLMSEVKPVMVRTGVKAYMPNDEYLALFNRSSNPKKLGLVVCNGVGVVDSDYYNNPDNEGELGFMFYNVGLADIVIKKGEKIGQGIFSKYFLADGDRAESVRSGGWGSTGV